MSKDEMDELHLLKYIEEDVKYLKTLGIHKVIIEDIITNGCEFNFDTFSFQGVNWYVIKPVNFGMYDIQIMRDALHRTFINSNDEYMSKNININEVIEFIKNMLKFGGGMTNHGGEWMSVDGDNKLYLNGNDKTFKYKELFPLIHS